MARYAITGSSGRIGRAIHRLLAQDHAVCGLDRAPNPATSVIADLCDEDALRRAFEGCDAVFHTAALHAPHVGLLSEAEFARINVEGTQRVLDTAREQGVRHVVFTSTTALYGYASQEEGRAAWITEETPPQPRTIYHRTKIEAEKMARDCADAALQVSVIRMSRCFPEPAPQMAAYRLHRGIDGRDVATAHVAALNRAPGNFACYNVSGQHPFERSDCEQLKVDAEGVLRAKAPRLAQAFDARGWPLPQSIDRVYVAHKAATELNWRSEFGPEEVLAQLDRRSLEVLPPEAGETTVEE